VVPTIDGVFSNNGENLCRCSVSNVDNCRCVPDATILPGGTGVNIMPGVNPRPGGFKGKPGRTYLLRFTGTAAVTGKTCVGFAQVCVIKQRRNLRGRAPPACAPFTSSVTLRDATRCGGNGTVVIPGAP
jgi:hypothetical protein